MRLTFFIIVLVAALPRIGTDTALAEPPGLRHTRSAVLTEAVPDIPFGDQSSPLLRKTPAGYCAAWFDNRQGGMAMMARLDPTGALLDQFGIPVKTAEGRIQSPWKAEIIADEERCTITYSEDFSVRGLSVATTGPAATRSFEFFDSGTWYWQVSGTDGERALISVHQPWGLELKLVDASGNILWAHEIETDYYQVRGVVDGLNAFLLVQPADRRGFLDLWKFTPEDATRFETEVVSSEIYHWDVVDEGDSLLVLDLNPAGAPGTVRFDRITKTGDAIATWSPEGMSAFDVDQMWRTDDGGVNVLTSAYEGMRLLRVVGTDVQEMARFDGLAEAAMTRDALPMSLWREPSSGKLLYRFGLPTFGPGSPITAAPRTELIADAVATDDGAISVLWVEASPATGAQFLRHGIVSPDHLALVSNDVVANGEIVGGTQYEVLPRASLAIANGVTQFAWIEGSALKIRAKASDGSWTGEPVTLSERAGTLHPEGLVATGGQFLLVWTDVLEDRVWPQQTALRVARIGTDGTVRPIDPDILGDAWHMTWPSIAKVGDRAVVALRGEPVMCRITCPPNWVVDFLAVDQDDAWSLLTHDSEHLATYTVPFMVVRDDLIMLPGDRLETFRLMGDSLISEEQAWSLSEMKSGMPWKHDFALVGRTSLGASSATEVLTLEEGLDVRAVQAVIPDASPRRAFPFIPALVATSGRLVLVSSEVSAAAEEGSVRRLRIHELVPETARRRAIRRR